MIGDDRDHGVVELLGLFEGVYNARHAAVHVRDLAVIGRRGKPGAKRRWRFVRRVGVVKMNPCEHRLTTAGSQPLDRLVDDLAAETLGLKLVAGAVARERGIEDV